jgi:site-specific DNA-methyltransferase (adenine-specific)
MTQFARCIQGDSTTDAAYGRALDGRKADVLMADPPYCLLVRRRRGGDPRDPKSRKNDHEVVQRFENVREYRDFTRAWLTTAARHLRPNAPLVIWTNLLGRTPIREVAAELGWKHVRGEFVWGKRTREGNSGEELLRVVETALVMSQTPSAPSRPEDSSTPWAVVAGYDDEGESERWGSHPNHKPFGVLEPLIRAWSRPGEVILDPFAGSGSIPAAAIRLERSVASIELTPHWADLVSRRLVAAAPAVEPEPLKDPFESSRPPRDE